jgi:hypothetical protein
MLRNVTFLALALILAIAMRTSGFAQSGQWVDLGSARLNGQMDHGTIQAHNQGTFRAIQIRGEAVRFTSTASLCVMPMAREKNLLYVM